jgi:lipopolysaccharide transport system permease protein
LEVWKARDLVFLFVRRDFVAVHKQTILGPLWFVIQPLLTTIMFSVIFGQVAHIPTDGTPPFLFYLSGTVIWSYFSTCFIKTADTFGGNASLFGKAYFPRLTVPISVLASNLITFGIQITVLIFFVALLRIRGAAVYPNSLVLLLPVVVLLVASLALGCGLIVSALTTRYRDLQHVVPFGVQLLMYATPVIYPISATPERYHWLFLANPLAPLVEAFRYEFLGVGTATTSGLAYSAGFALLLAGLGAVAFTRAERTFADTI